MEGQKYMLNVKIRSTAIDGTSSHLGGEIIKCLSVCNTQIMQERRVLHWWMTSDRPRQSKIGYCIR